MATNAPQKGPQTADVCSDATLSMKENVFYFVNHHPEVCHIHFDTPPPGADHDYDVPAKSGSQPGMTPVYYTPGKMGHYPHSASCCGNPAQTGSATATITTKPGPNNPVIHIQ
jgi:hypothetical protein